MDTWWRHRIEIFSVLLALCKGNPPVIGGFPSQRPVTQSFDVSLICAWPNGWVNHQDVGDLRRHRAHYDVIVMKCILWMHNKWLHITTTGQNHVYIVEHAGNIALSTYPLKKLCLATKSRARYLSKWHKYTLDGILSQRFVNRCVQWASRRLMSPANVNRLISATCGVTGCNTYHDRRGYAEGGLNPAWNLNHSDAI